MKVDYIFSTSSHTVSYKLGKMILPQLEVHGHGAECRVFRVPHRSQKCRYVRAEEVKWKAKEEHEPSKFYSSSSSPCCWLNGKIRGLGH